MGDRRETLVAVTEQLQEYDVITDAFLAKSFTDRLLIVDVTEGEQLPADALELIREHDFQAIDSLDTDDKRPRSAVGDVGGATRHHFVDMQTRGTHQSYVVS
ncbi:hypothetical protein [Halovenus halobia]|uniref:hypothetical protein n=1 Tax=Halovenus halobia TaxID=3396622 RepID=UPI003F57B375